METSCHLSFCVPPPPKKARVEIADEYEEACDNLEEESEDMDYDELEKIREKCVEEITKSEGFDIQTFPRFCPPAIKIYFDLEEISSKHPSTWSGSLFYKFGCIFSLNYAISNENKKQNKGITLEKVIKANCGGGEVYNTTFLAKDEFTGESKIYQTKVWFGVTDMEMEVLIFRERADQALQPGEDMQGVDMQVFPNLPAGDDLRMPDLDMYAWSYDSYYVMLCRMSIRFALRERLQKENEDLILLKVIKTLYGADLIFRSTFKAEDRRTKECKTYYTEVLYNMKNGELELQRFAEELSA